MIHRFAVTQSMSATTSCLRFPGQLNADLRKLAVNMIPFPRYQRASVIFHPSSLHFFVPTLSPLCARRSIEYQQKDISYLIEQLFTKRNSLADCDPLYGRYLTASVIFRGGYRM